MSRWNKVWGLVLGKVKYPRVPYPRLLTTLF
jgi:hypothetical protein